MEYELDCRYDSRKSFYGKARVKEFYDEQGTRTLELISYSTTVARIIGFEKAEATVSGRKLPHGISRNSSNKTTSKLTT